MRKNPFVLSDKEHQFIKELKSFINNRTVDTFTVDDIGSASWFDEYHNNIVRTEFSFEWSVKGDDACKVTLELTTLREMYKYDTQMIQKDQIGKIYTKYGVLLEKGWVPNVDGFYISYLNVSPNCRGKGYGLDVLKMMLELSTRHEVYLTWSYDTSVKEKQAEGSNAIENLKAWYKKSGALFSPIASELDFYDFVYPDYILDAYQGLVFDDEMIKRVNPGEMAGIIVEGFPRKWWYTDEDWRIMVQAMQRQYKDPDNYWTGQFEPDEFELRDLEATLAEERLINVLSDAGNPMIGLSSDWASIAFGSGEPEIVFHGGMPVEVYPQVLFQEDEMDERPWSLLEYQGRIDPETDFPLYEVVSTEPSEHYLRKILEKDYLEFLEDHDAEPLQFPVRTNFRGVDTPKKKVKSKKKIKVAKKVVRDGKGRKIPEKYLAGYNKTDRKKRIKEIEQRRDEYQDALDKYGDEDDFPKSVLKKLYRPFKTDQGIKSKESPYTTEAKRRGFKGSIANKAKQASKYYGGKIPVEILKEVNARGMAAAISGGHRPGQNSHSWGVARVNSFLVGGKTFFTSDSDLATRGIVKKDKKTGKSKTIVSPLPKKVQAAIKKERHWKG